jgi:Zn-dependent peptidase ImmA (M78 family)
MTPEEHAKNLLDEYGIKSPDKLDMEKIAWAEFLAIEVKPMETHSGRIRFENDYGIISLKNSFREPGQKRFTLAHELGHYFIERNSTLRKFNCSSKDLLSFSFGPIFEKKANEFVAELLMFKPWFGDFIRKRDINMDLLKDISNHFGVTLSAAAIRYSLIGKYPIAVIMSKKEKPTDKYGKVSWSSIHEYFPLKWLPKGLEVSKDSFASAFFKGEEMQEGADLVPASAWFSQDRNCNKSDLWEENLAMPNYNQVLTILWAQKK